MMLPLSATTVSSQRTANLLDQYAQGCENHRCTEYEPGVGVEEFHHFAIFLKGQSANETTADRKVFA
jgi:hypothetical protein